MGLSGLRRRRSGESCIDAATTLPSYGRRALEHPPRSWEEQGGDGVGACHLAFERALRRRTQHWRAELGRWRPPLGKTLERGIACAFELGLRECVGRGVGRSGACYFARGRLRGWQLSHLDSLLCHPGVILLCGISSCSTCGMSYVVYNALCDSSRVVPKQMDIAPTAWRLSHRRPDSGREHMG